MCVCLDLLLDNSADSFGVMSHLGYTILQSQPILSLSKLGLCLRTDLLSICILAATGMVVDACSARVRAQLRMRTAGARNNVLLGDTGSQELNIVSLVTYARE